jgi:transcriptional regulator with XRE-family HTH domain
MQYGEIIKMFRKNKGLTQEELGNLIGRKQNQISEWESGKVNPTHEDISKLCNVFGINILLKFYNIEDEHYLAIEHARNKGMTPDEIIKAIEIFRIYKDK